MQLRITNKPSWGGLPGAHHGRSIKAEVLIPAQLAISSLLLPLGSSRLSRFFGDSGCRVDFAWPAARYAGAREVRMPIVLSEWATSQEISSRIDRLRTRYAGNPLVKRIDHHIGVDWSDDPAVFVKVILPGDIAPAELQRLAEDIRVDLLRLVRTDEIGLHSYLNFVN